MEYIKKDPKIFLISGKARSGKNKLSRMIAKYYNNKKSIAISFGYYVKDYAKRISDWDGSEETKPRDLLQSLGIELIKEKIDNRLFINRIIEDIEVFSYFYDVIIVSDVRLLDEIESLKKKYNNSISLRIVRKERNNLTDVQNKHITEIDLDNYNKFDYTIINDDGLQDKINKILEEL